MYNFKMADNLSTMIFISHIIKIYNIFICMILLSTSNDKLLLFLFVILNVIKLQVK